MPLIQKAWDHSKTLSQNYSEIGLQSFLNGKAGGSIESASAYSKLKTKLNSIKEHLDTEWVSPDELLIRESSATSAKLKTEVLIGEPEYEYDDRVKNLGSRVNLKKLRNFAIRENIEKESAIVHQLREFTNVQVVKRCNSSGETDLLVALTDKYGDDYEAMSRDCKLNKYQLSAGQLKKKFKRLSLVK